jgi:3-deoxy-D-arabino-heptulosonate 7-phosphate (DAHP) synthase class II
MNPVRTSQETYYISATETNRLMLFGETVAVYCENHTEHRNPARTSQETYYASTTKTNRLMLFVETVAVYCQNHTQHTDTVRTSHETLRLRYRDQPDNAFWGNSRCLL